MTERLLSPHCCRLNKVRKCKSQDSVDFTTDWNSFLRNSCRIKNGIQPELLRCRSIIQNAENFHVQSLHNSLIEIIHFFDIGKSSSLDKIHIYNFSHDSATTFASLL